MRTLTIRILSGVVLVVAAGLSVAADTPELSWHRLPDLPDEQGFAGMYAGISGGALIAAGGANFERKADGGFGTKIWFDTIYVLSKPDGQWKRAETTLPRPLGYGVSVTYNDTVICIGGNNAEGLHADVFSLRWDGEKIHVDSLPELPQPNAYAAGARVGDTVYVAGGVPEPGAGEARRSFYALDLSAEPPDLTWQRLEPWPGTGRQTAVAGAQDGQFLLISGVALEPDSEGKPGLVVPYLTDAYAYRPGQSDAPGQWRRLADAPRPIAAAPGPALPLGDSSIAVCGGIDGSTNDVPADVYPPFPRTISVYDLKTDRWRVIGQMPEGSSRVTAPTAQWDGGYVIISGELRPRFRSPQVYIARRMLETIE